MSKAQRPPAPIWVLAVVGVIFSLLPLGYLVVRTTEIGFGNLVDVYFRKTSINAFLNSFALVVLVTATALIVGIAQAWLVVRTQFRFKSIVTFSALTPLAIPSYIAAYSWLSVFPGFSGLWAAWIVLSLCTSPYVFLATSSALIRNNRTTEEVARTLGYSPWQTLRLVTWPEIRTAAYSSGLLCALYVLSDFGAVSLLRFETFTRAIFTAYRAGFDRSTAAALALLLVLVTLALLAIHNRLPETQNRRSEKALQIKPAALGRWRTPVFIAISIWLSAGTLLPLGSLIYWNVIGSSESDLAAIGRALINTVGYALAGSLLITLVGIAVAVLIARYKSRFAKTVEKSIWISHSLPGIVFALAFVFLSNKFLPAIYQTNLLLILAYLGLFLPNALSVLKTPFTQIPTSTDEVARSFGYSQLQVIKKVIVPAALPGIFSAFAFVALTIIKELPTTLVLRPTGIETMATRLWAETSVNAFSAAAPYAALLIILAGIPALLLNQEIRRSQMSSNLIKSEDSNVERA